MAPAAGKAQEPGMNPPRQTTIGVPPRFILESLVRRDGTVQLDQAHDVAEALGIAGQTLRLAVRRTTENGSFVQFGRGRRGVLRRTAAADLIESHDVEFVRFAYAQDEGAVVWDGWWRLLAVSVPEDQRPVRDRVRRTLLRLGAGHLQAGLYVSPHDVSGQVHAECPELDTIGTVARATTRDLRVGKHTDSRSLAAAVWDLESVAAGHAVLAQVAEATIARAATLSRSGRTAAALELAWAFDRAHVPDPLLPPPLLPDDWIGARTRASFAKAWALVVDQDSGDDAILFERFK